MRRATFFLALATACSSAPVEWQAPLPIDAYDNMLGSVTPPPTAEGQCRATVRTAKDPRGDWYAAWWSVRADSSADVVVAASSDGKTWSPAARADTADVGKTACRRTPPSIAADNGVVHIAYSMTAREGDGIFVTHSMDKVSMFHTPVAIVYGAFDGDAAGRTAIAARGSTVAVAYEDPNSKPVRIGVALSTTMAHVFEWRGLVSPETGGAIDPSMTLISDTVAVSWTRVTDGSTRARMRVLGILRGKQ
jgi:hypothetical protein